MQRYDKIPTLTTFFVTCPENYVFFIRKQEELIVRNIPPYWNTLKKKNERKNLIFTPTGPKSSLLGPVVFSVHLGGQ